MGKSTRGRSKSRDKSPKKKGDKSKRSRSSSRKAGEKRKEKRSPSKKRDRSRSKAKKKSSRDRSKKRSKSRSTSRRKTKKSREKKSRSRSRSKRRKSRSKEKKRSSSRKKDEKKEEKKEVKKIQPPEPTQEVNEPNRASPSYDRGKGSASPSPENDDDSKQEDAPKIMEVVSRTLDARPFGMAPSKEDGVSGYVVAKVADNKPADQAGVRPGWQVVSIAGKSCRGQDHDVIQGLLKEAALPVVVEFEKEKEVQAGGDDEDESDEELDIMDVRAEHRIANQSGMELLDELPVKRSPDNLPAPIANWQDAVDRKLLNGKLMGTLQTAGLKRPTLIQRHTVPIVCHGDGGFGHYDMIASAQTGSGKTFGFVIPTVARLIMQGVTPRPFFPGASAQLSPLVVVLSPTRELAMQTAKEVETLTKGSPLTSIVVYGGETLKFQQQKITKENADIICGTPGRLLDFVDCGAISLSFTQSVVLDEADQMLEQSLEVICAQILQERDMPDPAGRQTLLFSATMPQKIRDLVPNILRQAQGRVANITVGHYEDNKGGSCSAIRQVLRWVPDEHSRGHVILQDLQDLWIRPGKRGRVVVFTNQRLQAGNLHKLLISNGISCLHLHGKLDQADREDIFDRFRRGLADVLVATNLASRGLDFPDISLVIQYNIPQTVDIYTHRIGRTGRVGQVGCALAYVGPKDRQLFPKLVDFLELNQQEVPRFLLPRDGDRDRRGPSDKGKGFGKFLQGKVGGKFR